MVKRRLLDKKQQLSLEQKRIDESINARKKARIKFIDIDSEKRRLGKFRVVMDIIRECPDIWNGIKDRVTIINAGPTDDEQIKEYMGESDLFEKVNPKNIPFYRFEFVKKDGKIIIIGAVRIKENGSK
jgi:hypothetical protein